MLLVYCADMLARRQPDPAYAEEVAADALNIEHALIRLEALVDEGDGARAVTSVPASDLSRLGVYRGWMVHPAQYARLYEALARRSVHLINDADAYAACHLFPASYDKIAAMTPRTVWMPLIPGSPLPDWSVLSDLLQPFGDSPMIVKDYV